MKNYLIVTIIVLLAIIGGEYQQVKYANERWLAAEANVKSYDGMLAASNNQNAALQLTVSQLNCFQDSILKELDKTRKELKIKDSRLQSLQYIASSFSKADTIIISDTVFCEPGFHLDTLIGDTWYNIRIGLKYPSEITVFPLFRSEKHVVVSSRKETVNPPKKFFLLRWLQRKHLILHVDVIEKNPYVDSESNRYIEIIE